MPRLLAIVLLLAATAPAAERPPLLPDRFAEWEKTAPTQSDDPAAADPANAALLREYGFVDFESATYARAGRSLKIKAARFHDTGGSYGAFTFYKVPAMVTEKIGDQASSLNEHVLFYRGNILVDAVFDRVTAMSAAELRELAEVLPRAASAGPPPALLVYLPRQSYVKNSAKYAVGPVGLARIDAPITAELADFSKSTEVALGRYHSSTGEAKLTLLSYPTPQIAGERLRAIEQALLPAGAEPPEDDNVAVKRTGPIVVLVTGNIPTAEAKALLAAVTYDANVTWNEPTSLALRDQPFNLIWNIVLLIGILALIMLALGIMTGGIRIALRRFFPQYVEAHEEAELIRLRLGESGEGSGLPPERK